MIVSLSLSLCVPVCDRGLALVYKEFVKVYKNFETRMKSKGVTVMSYGHDGNAITINAPTVTRFLKTEAPPAGAPSVF